VSVGEYVTKVRSGQRVRPGRYTVRDVDFRQPTNYRLQAQANDGKDLETRLERYHYVPGGFLFESDKGEESPIADDKARVRADESEGQRLAQRRLEAKRATARTFQFETNAYRVEPGAVITINGHANGFVEGRRLLVVSRTLRAEAAKRWHQECEAVSADVPYRPALETSKPKVSGVETATVVGPAGEEIHTDEFGRIRVHFHWDRESRFDDNSSCWIPSSQPWSGTGFGGMNLPRVGQEVIVDFLGGDPDRPVIVGRLYTNTQKVPYKLPENKTQSGWKSMSSPGGGGFNELSFEDKKGSELLNMQAERDMHELVKHDQTHTVGNDRTKTIQHDETTSVGNDRTETVGNNETITVGKDRIETVAKNEEVMIGENRSVMVGMNERQVVGQNLTRAVGANETVKIGGNRDAQVGGNDTLKVTKDLSITAKNVKTKASKRHSLTVGLMSNEQIGVAKTLSVGLMYQTTVAGIMNTSVGRNMSEQVKGNKSVKVSKKITAKSGKTISITAGTSLKIAAAEQIILECGASKIILNKDGRVFIGCKHFTCDASTSFDVNSEMIDLN
jgi:type VI secretion system secreted protein VgrG